jgi:hypothetical protein
LEEFVDGIKAREVMGVNGLDRFFKAGFLP